MRRFLLPYFLRVVIAGLLAFPAKAQKQLIDSLESQLKKSVEDTAKIILLNELVTKYQHVNPERAMVLASHSVNLARRLNFDFGLGTAYRLTGVLFTDKSNFDRR